MKKIIRLMVFISLLTAFSFGAIACSMKIPGGLQSPQSVETTESGLFETGMFDESAAEIVAFDSKSKKIFFTNGKDGSLVILHNNDGIWSEEKKITFDQGDVNSVAVYKNLAAVAVAASDKTENGLVVFIDTKSGKELGSVSVGALPDMVKFTPDGKYVLSANEGEPSEKYTKDPAGSVSIIKVNYKSPANSEVVTLTFSDVNKESDSAGVPVRTHSYLKNYLSNYKEENDIEPEYIAVDKKSRYAYVSCQENNAIAKIDIAEGKIVVLKSLGFKDFTECGVDFVEDGKVDIKPQPYYGLFMPDSLTTFEVNGKTYIATANEGDDRGDWEDGTDFEDNDVTKAKNLEKDFNLTLDPSLLDKEGKIRKEYKSLRVSPHDCIDSDGDGDIDILVGFGGRSFTIWDEDLNKVYDSGSLFETYTAEVSSKGFNSSNSSLLIDDRSPKKGPEPEAICSGVIDNTPLLFVGLERFGGFFTFDVSDPANPKMLGFTTNRNFNADTDEEGEYTNTSVANTGDLGPEGFCFVGAKESGTKKAQLIIGNEVSGTVRVYDLSLVY